MKWRENLLRRRENFAYYAPSPLSNNFDGLLMIVLLFLNRQVYGIFCGGYHYSLKMYTYERVRARNFARTWGFVQCSQALPIAFGVPITGKFSIQPRIAVY